MCTENSHRVITFEMHWDLPNPTKYVPSRFSCNVAAWLLPFLKSQHRSHTLPENPEPTTTLSKAKVIHSNNFIFSGYSAPGAVLGAGGIAGQKIGKDLALTEPICQWSHSSEVLSLFFLPLSGCSVLFSYLPRYACVSCYGMKEKFLSLSILINLWWRLFIISVLSCRYFRGPPCRCFSWKAPWRTGSTFWVRNFPEKGSNMKGDKTGIPSRKRRAIP